MQSPAYEQLPEVDTPCESDRVSLANGSIAATLSAGDSEASAVQRSSAQLDIPYDVDDKLGTDSDTPRSDPSRIFSLSKRHAASLKNLVGDQPKPEAAGQDRLPPTWFLSKAARARYEQLATGFRRSGVVPSGDELKTDSTKLPTDPVRPESESIFLSSPLLQQLDRPLLYVPVYCCLAIMAGVAPALSYTLIPRDNLHGRSTLVDLHVASLVLLWSSYIHMFNSLRSVVRPRNSHRASPWLNELAHELLMEDADTATDTDELIAQITTHLRDRGAKVWAEKTHGAVTLQNRWRMHVRRKTMHRRSIVLYSDSTCLRLLLRAFKRWMAYTMRVKQLRNRPAISVADEKDLVHIEQLQLRMDTYGERTVSSPHTAVVKPVFD